jgi:D-alanyl-D-alanine dipeptidase
MRYATDWNFTGRIVPGYKKNRCILSKPAALQLAKVQESLRKKNLSLLMLDCYRPARSVKAFVEWTKDAGDLKMKSFFYPDEPKDTLIERGYIADRSGHSRGSTVDLTLVRLPLPATKDGPLRFRESGEDCRKPREIEKTGQLDMGTAYDCFSTLANTGDQRITDAAMKNRLLLRTEMEAAGFENYPKEWWHFTLKDEPFRDRYFDFH